MERYEKYKPSGIEWIGEIPQEWSIKRLKYIANIKTGYTPSKDDDENYSEDGICWVKPDELMGLEIIADSKTKISNKGIKKSNIVPADSILVCCIGSIGKFGIAGIDLTTNQQINAVIFANEVKSEFGKYLIASSEAEHNRCANGNVVKILNSENQGNINFPIPPIREQQAIAEYLDEKCGAIDTLIERKERLLELYAEKRQAIINCAVTRGIDPNISLKDSGIPYIGQIPAHWEVKKLKYIVKVNPIKDIGIDKKTDECITFLPMEKVSENGNIDCEIKKPINDLSSGFTFFRKNDILIAKITPCFENGKGALLDKLDTEFGFGSTEFHVIRCGEKVCEKFIFYIIKSSIFMNLGEAMMTGSAGQKRVPTIFIENYLLGVPTLSEQTTIVKYIEEKCGKIDQICEKLRQQIDLYREYRTALIANAVTGKIKI